MISKLSFDSFRRSLTKDETQSIENRAKNYDIDDVYILEYEIWSDYFFELLCNNRACVDYVIDEYTNDLLLQEIVKCELCYSININEIVFYLSEYYEDIWQQTMNYRREYKKYNYQIF